jgi:hypothetical protein
VGITAPAASRPVLISALARNPAKENRHDFAIAKFAASVAFCSTARSLDANDIRLEKMQPLLDFGACAAI